MNSVDFICCNGRIQIGDGNKVLEKFESFLLTRKNIFLAKIFGNL